MNIGHFKNSFFSVGSQIFNFFIILILILFLVSINLNLCYNHQGIRHELTFFVHSIIFMSSQTFKTFFNFIYFAIY